MYDSTPAFGAETAWRPIEPLPCHEAQEFVRTARIALPARRAYMGTYIVCEATADTEIRHLLERFLQTGRLARGVDGTLRVRSPTIDGSDAYAFYLDRAHPHVVGFRGPAVSWFDRGHVPLEDVLRRRAERRTRMEEARQRRAAHERRMREQEEDAARRRAEALRPMWPVMAMGQYDRHGTAVPVPSPRRPVTEEARIRHVGRRPHVVFHADALNSPFFAKVPLEKRCEALTRVLDVLLRRPSEGKVSIGPGSITVSGRKVTLTLTPDCAMVRTLNPPRKGDKNIPPLYRAERWPVDRPRPPRRDRSNAESPTDTETPHGGDRFATIDE